MSSTGCQPTLRSHRRRSSPAPEVGAGERIGFVRRTGQHPPVAALVGTDPLDLPGRAQLVQPVPDDRSRGAEGGGDFAAARVRILAKESQDTAEKGWRFWRLAFVSGGFLVGFWRFSAGVLAVFWLILPCVPTVPRRVIGLLPGIRFRIVDNQPTSSPVWPDAT